MDAVAQPFETSAENALQIFAQGVIFFTLAIGGMVQTGGNNDADCSYKTATVDSNAVSALIIFINAAVFVGAAALLWLNRVHARTKCCRGGRRRISHIDASNENSTRDAGSAPSTPNTNMIDGPPRCPATVAWQDAKGAVGASSDGRELHGPLVDRWAWVKPFVDTQLATNIDDVTSNA